MQNATMRKPDFLEAFENTTNGSDHGLATIETLALEYEAHLLREPIEQVCMHSVAETRI